jgi:hypothetical protein
MGAPRTFRAGQATITLAQASDLLSIGVLGLCHRVIGE